MNFIAQRRPVAIALVGLLATFGCTTKNYYEQTYVTADGDAGAHEPPPVDVDVDAGSTPTDPPAEPDAGPAPIPGAPVADVPGAELEVDVFGTVGNHYFFAVSEEELERMNERYDNGGPIFFANPYGDIYAPGGVDSNPTFVDHLFVTTAGSDPRTADFGQVEVKLIGESTGRPWTPESLPNFKIDSDEFQEGLRIGGVKHFRLNNAVVGSIYREKLTLDLYAKLGYPAPRATFAWVSNTVWGPDIAVPYVVVESYKPHFCKEREDELAGGCENMWELPGDFGYGAFTQPEACQFTECENQRVNELDELVMTTPHGDGYKAALADWIDWDAFHRFQCLSWVLQTGDDALHNTNNLVLVERMDGKFQYLPYSVDISLGQDWYPDVPLPGGSSVANGCQSDVACWADTIATCEQVIADFEAADPVAMLDEIHETLKSEGMLRDGDADRYKSLRTHLKQHLKQLPVELEENREAPNGGNGYCEQPMVDCGGWCAYPEECYVCDPAPLPEPILEPAPDPRPAVDADGAADVAIVIGDPLPVDPIPVEPEPLPPPVDGCLPLVDAY